uniref:Reverse transcriptase Ty1/copia-type domain-containing protein n=1 Tax=Amphimedon queenslandica TaxID=400682 RepID=A0A1X7TEV8_AMPQE
MGQYSNRNHPLEPDNLSEALASPEKDKWIDAMNKEVRSLKTNEVYDLMELPDGKRAIGCKWVHEQRIDLLRGIKLDLSDQQAGLNYEIFCPVVEYKSIRYVVSVAAQMGTMLHQMDVTSAFLKES